MARFDAFSAPSHSAKTRVATGGTPESISGARSKVSRALNDQIARADRGEGKGKALWYKKLDTADLWTISLRYGNQMIFRDKKSEADRKPFFGEFNSVAEVAAAYRDVKEDVDAGKFDSGIEPAWKAAQKRGAALRAKRAEKG
tara:strand:- start:709 stop:1137 length:429 start_codon:yes stop_codon:yes gene_type:complete